MRWNLIPDKQPTRQNHISTDLRRQVYLAARTNRMTSQPGESPRCAESDAFMTFDSRLDDFELGESLSNFPLAALPPMPTPKHKQLRNQVTGGVAVVAWCICCAEGAIYALGYWCDFQPFEFWTLVGAIIHTQAVIAIIAHACLLYADPGVMQRSREDCLPLPPTIGERLRAGDSLHDLADNIYDTSRARNDADVPSSFCVRCCLWRRPPPPPANLAVGKNAQWLWANHPKLAKRCPCAGGAKAHHCSTCNRCVVAFDHHCGVLGRCISAANMPYFATLLLMGQTASLTCAVAFIGFVSQMWGTTGARWALIGCAQREHSASRGRAAHAARARSPSDTHTPHSLPPLTITLSPARLIASSATLRSRAAWRWAAAASGCSSTSSDGHPHGQREQRGGWPGLLASQAMLLRRTRGCRRARRSLGLPRARGRRRS